MAVGPVTVCLELAAYRQLVVLLNESASNLELLFESSRPGGVSPSGDSCQRETHS